MSFHECRQPRSGDSASNNFIEFDADVDDLVLQLASGGSFGALSAALQELMVLVGPDHEDLEGSFQLLDVDVTAGINPFKLGDDIIIRDAKNLDANKDGKIEFSLLLKPNVTLDNNISIGFNGAGDLWFWKNDPTGIIDPLHVTLFSEPIAAIPIDDGGPFTLAFQQQNYGFLV
jgi:hypothetical protein